jgi:AraC-like DNA-binding protein
LNEFQKLNLSTWIKILFLKKTAIIQIDFQQYQLENDMLFFISPHQFFNIEALGKGFNCLIKYNRDFYCVEIHDKEVSCDGILYNNVYEIPAIVLTDEHSVLIESILEEITTEIQFDEIANEEMIRILLKKIIIKSTRIWKTQHHLSKQEVHQEVEFLRKFSQLVEKNFRVMHSVTEYADILGITAKTLTKRISKYSIISPIEIIKNRVILEAKRLLLFTDLSVKEIAYSLGYDDPAYFNRLFSKSESMPPAEYRLQKMN